MTVSNDQSANDATTTKGKRGSKTCPNCQGSCGPRSFECKHCGHEFSGTKAKQKSSKEKKVRPKNEGVKLVLDWQSLERGQFIRVSGGPYHKSSQGKTRLFDKGVYRVTGIDENGLNVMAVGRKGSGAAHVYMGPRKISPVLKSIVRVPHKVQLIERPTR